MTDIELVIKIPKEDFERCKKRFQRRIDIMGDAIANGTPLPKGHGRLFDERDIVNGNYKIIGHRIYELEPIIEADKESEVRE